MNSESSDGTLDSWRQREQLLEKFEQAWQSGATPNLADYLPTEGAERRSLLIELVRVDMEFRRKAGLPARLDDYLTRFPDLPLETEALAERRQSEVIATRKPTVPADATRSVGSPDAFTPSRDNAPNVFAPPVTPGDIGKLGRYRILRKLGQGGMGVVYLALDERLHRHVALKVMVPKYAANKDAKERFLREARAAARINNDHVVAIHEADEIDGTPFIALQFLQGCSLADYLRTNNQLAIPEILRIGREAALGLAAAHQLGLVHRDIKPANLWLDCSKDVAAGIRDESGQLVSSFLLAPLSFRLKIVDFGLAKSVDSAESTELTGMGVLIGTPAYMSPEQARGEKVDHRTDLFSLGSVLYRVCGGRMPFQGETLMAKLTALAVDGPTPLRQLNHAVPEQFAVLIHQMLSKRPDERPASASEVGERLATIAAQQIYNSKSSAVCSASDEQARQIGRYRIEKVLGEGGFGRVYLVYDDQLNRSVAIKVPRPERLSRPEDAEAYLAEARVVASLDHPNIVPIFDVGTTPDGLCYVVSKFFEGSDLAKKIRQTRPSYTETAELIATVAEALHYAHSRGVVHRDIKPGNILLDKSGKPFVADFGLALKEEDFGKGVEFAGTPAYMSPEQAHGEGHRVDGRSDIFSLGVVFYEVLTGRRPFKADSQKELLEQITKVEARPPRQVDDRIPKELERICLKALCKRASERYSTAKDMADELRQFLIQTPLPEQASARSEQRHSNFSFAIQAKKRGCAFTVTFASLWVMVGAAMGSWFLLKMNAKDEVLGLIEKKDFSAAWKTITNKRWLLSSPEELEEEVEKNWCAKLRKAELNREDLKALNEFRSELDEFEKAFPRNADIKPRQKIVLDFLAAAVLKDEVRKFIDKGDFPAALKMITNKRSFLSSPEQLEEEVEKKWCAKLKDAELDREDLEALKGFLPKLDEFKDAFPQNAWIEKRRAEVLDNLAAIGNKERVLAVLKDAKKKLDEKDYEKCLTVIKEAKGPFDKGDLAQKKTIQALAESGILLIRNDLVAQAWNSLLKDKVVPEDCRTRLRTIKRHASFVDFDPFTKKNVDALEALVKAHEADEKNWGQAFEPLIRLVNEKKPGELNRNLWKALAQLEKTRNLFRFQDLDGLEKAFPDFPDDEVKKANSQILAHALERLVEKEYWFATSQEEWAKCSTWCDRVGPQSDWIKALKAECLVESKKPVAQVGPWPEAGWYGSYIHALLLKDKQIAAESLTSTLKDNPELLKPPTSLYSCRGHPP